jgi:hypothetical protein
MAIRTTLHSLHIGPELRLGGQIRIGRSPTGAWTVETHQGQILATLYTPGIPDDEIELRETSLAVEIVRVHP